MQRRVYLLIAFSTLPFVAAFAPPDGSGVAISPAFTPFEHLAGGWKGMGIPKANRLKGWPERHLWSWKFQDGNPVALAIAFEGDKTLTKGQLAYDPAAKRYTLEGTTPEGRPASFSGTMDPKGQTLTLERSGLPAGEQERLTLRLNANRIRYTVWLDRQEAGSPQFSRVIEINVGKEGEEFAAGAAAANVPKCVMTGGAATMSVTYEGKSYPVCCTGCRDEFLENPEKYVKLAALKAKAASDKPKAAQASVGADDGAFDGLVEDSKKPARPASKAAPKSNGDSAKAAPTGAEPAPKQEASRASDAATRAAALLRSAQSLDKLGKASAALEYYRQIVAKYPNTPQAKTATERIKALAP
jgi:YHS domain-containing protein